MTSPRTAALRLLGRRDYTIHELREKLARDHPTTEVDAVLDAFRADGSLDDARVAAAHVRTGSQVKGRGRHRLRRELEARGVSSTLIADALAELDPEVETAAIERLLDRKRLPSPLPHADRRRLFQQLLRRGFPSDAIASALRRR